MAGKIEDYALLSDCQTAALVCRDGSIDWLCLPRFDSGACFAALLGTSDNGRWKIAPAGDIRNVRRRYREKTWVLETEFDAGEGTVLLVDCLVALQEKPVLVRQVKGLRGQVPMEMEFILRFDYGSVVPWVRREKEGLSAVAGPDMVYLQTDAKIRGKDFKTVGNFSVSAGEEISFAMSWHLSYQPSYPQIDVSRAIAQTEDMWRKWSARFQSHSDWEEAVLRSLLVLKAITYAPTGGIVAAVTASLPEQLGGVRNWDYRYCWVRDATLTLYALMVAGFTEEAKNWREWLLRAVAGKPSEIQIMYGLAGERRLTEFEIPWLRGYENSSPVRIGNAASGQFQLDVYGELLDSMYLCRKVGLEAEHREWALEQAVIDFLETAWKEPDEGIWEVRGPRRHFTHSKVMAWVALDRAVKSIERFRLDGPLEKWRKLRAEIHEEVCRQGFNPDLNSFVQSYGSNLLDASLLMIPLVGFLPASDSRVRGTVEAIERHLLIDGFVARYSTQSSVDGLPPGEGAFLACTFWLADNFYILGRKAEARELFERLLDLRNDVGLLAEEYDPVQRRMVGNFPQAFSHVGLINTAHNLSPDPGPADLCQQD